MQELMELAELLHMFCQQKHPNDTRLMTMEDSQASHYGCLWFLEEQMADCWSRTAHAHWLSLAEDVHDICKKADIPVCDVERELKNLFRIYIYPPKLKALILTLLQGGLK